jgi:uncharacterized protein YlxP (DUF503 family)
MSVCLGMLTVEIMIPASHSLKERRAVVNSLKERIRNRHNVSLAESGPDNVWQRANLNIACVADSQSTVDHILRSVIQLIDEEPRCESISPRIEYYA